MTGIRKGDRVRVEFEGEVLLSRPDGDLWVYPDDTSSGTCVYSHVDWCTVIVPPIKVGDVVTKANVGQLPELSVISRPGFAPLFRCDDGRWRSAGSHRSYSDTSLLNDDYGRADEDFRAVVLRIGGGAR